MKKPVSLAQIKAEKSLEDIALIKQSCLSVMPITEAEFRRILELGNQVLDQASAQAAKNRPNRLARG